MKKCCYINWVAIILLLLGIIIVYYYINIRPIQNTSEKIVINNNIPREYNPYSTIDPLLNPYAPPLNNINISTNIGAVDISYRQVGILHPLNGKSKDNILSLMGRPVFTNRDKWQYYSISNQHNNVKLPLSQNGKSCTNDYGCNKLYSGDTVYIEGINEAYKATVYDNDTLKYLPF